MDAPHRGHTGKLHTILNDVMNLAVAHPLRQVGVQIRDSRILVCADHGAAVAIHPVAGSALRHKLLSPLFECHIVISQRIGSLAFIAGNSKVA